MAEAAKVIENTQRDLNIALMNEPALIFDKIGIDTLEVLQAAGTGMPLHDLLAKLKQGGMFADVKSAYDQEAVRGAGCRVWRL